MDILFAEDIPHTIMTVLLALIAGLPGFISLFIQYRKSKMDECKNEAEVKSMEVETMKKVTEAAESLLDPYKGVIEDLNKAFEGCKSELGKIRESNEEVLAINEVLTQKVQQLELIVEKLILQLNILGYTPDIEIPEIKKK